MQLWPQIALVRQARGRRDAQRRAVDVPQVRLIYSSPGSGRPSMLWKITEPSAQVVTLFDLMPGCVQPVSYRLLTAIRSLPLREDQLLP